MNDNHTKKILLIDDHQLIAEGLALILRNIGCGVDVTICNDEQTPLRNTDRLKQFDLVIVDLNRPNFSGFGFLMAVQAQKSGLPVALLSGSERKLELERELSLGEIAFIDTTSSSEQLIRTVKQLLNGKRNFPRLRDREICWLLKDKTTTRITTRQMQVLELLKEGLQNKQIAVELNISAYSVKDHVKGLFRYFQVHNRTSCVQVARDRQVI